ncbi:hypothetical protein PHET_05726 [Paragonimus heterotremus]|uniref:UHRF1-binding protein 1-like n=1 Tax=Paragonimus heterotremus TaxID=100268 RepID=A0A8J4WGQ6_9TREM|nr:hypothetical protein PHET_05726 [Paragonimus heterotremus]
MFKIRWTKLDTHPVYVVIDRVDVEVEALEQPRSETDSGIASYRTGSGKYRLADKVVDGASVLINSVFIHLHAQAFQASVEMSRVSLASKTPTWQNGSLKLTSLILPSADAVLIFKELTWDSIRIVADGLLAELNGIPVKLITNAGRIRLTLKKCLSDSTLISSRSQFFLEDLLWVLTLSQLEAAIVFLRSLKHVVWLAAEQSKQYAASRAKRQTLSWKNVHNNSEIPITRPRRLQNKDPSSAVTRFFNRYDVVETSYHVYIYRTEVHFCDEVPAEVDMAATPNGYIKVHFYGFEMDWYPYHLDALPYIVFAQLKPVYVRFDADTVIWLNAFLLTLHLNLTTFLEHGMLRPGEDDLTERKRLHIRCAALMPRIILPLNTHSIDTGSTGRCYAGPDALVVQQCDANQFWCLHCPHFWAQFLTVLEVFESPANFRSALGHTRRAIYRQSFIDPLPLSLWLTVSSNPSLDRPPLELLIDVDCFSNPLVTDDWRNSGVSPPSLSTDPVQFYLGATPTTSRRLYWIPSECARLPDALDQLFLLAGLFGQLSLVKDQLGLDMVRIMGASNRSHVSHATVIHWFCTLSFKMHRCIDFHVTALESEDLPFSREFDVHVSDSSPHNESTQVPNVQRDSTDCFSSQGFESSDSPLLFLSQEACAAQGLYSLSTSNMVLNGQQRTHHADSQTNLVIHTVNSPGTGQKPTCTPHAFIGQQAIGEPTHYLNVRRSPNGSLLPDSDSLSSEMNSSVDNLSVAGSQDDWLNAYELLSAFDDNRSVDLDSVYEGPVAGATAPTQNVSCPLIPEEIGTDVLESTSPPLEYSHQLSSDSAALRRNSLQTISNKPQTRQPPNGNSSIVIRLHHLIVVADTTDSELRFWLRLGQICFSHLSKTTDIQSSHPSPMFFSVQPSSEHSPLWSFFVSIFKESSNDAEHKPYWDSEFSIHANLLSNWSIPLPFPIRHILTQMLSELPQRLRCEYPQWLTDRYGALSCVNTSPSAVDIQVHLRGGSLDLDLISSPEDACLSELMFKKIHLQQGLSIVLDKDQIVRLFYEQLQPSLRNNLLGSTDNADQTNSTHDSALEQCLVENEHLKFEVHRLTAKVHALQSELEVLRNVLNQSSRP